jgi:hypothetical protein
MIEVATLVVAMLALCSLCYFCGRDDGQRSRRYSARKGEKFLEDKYRREGRARP